MTSYYGRNTVQRIRRATLLLSASCLITACHSTIIQQTDREVYRVIEDRQRAALGTTSNADIGPESGEVSGVDRMYSFTPRPTDSEIPEPFHHARSDNSEPQRDVAMSVR